MCVHHWRIDEPNGRMSAGTCLRCGSAREFPNSLSRPDHGDWSARGPYASEPVRLFASRSSHVEALQTSDEPSHAS